MNNISLTSLDCVKLNQHDSHIPCHFLDPDTLENLKLLSKSKRHFISNLCRKMFAMEERIRDCNVAGLKSRAPMSPDKSRYHTIVRYTAQLYQVDKSYQLGVEVRAVIDDTNRKYREEIKRRKSLKIVQESTIALQNDDA